MKKIIPALVAAIALAASAPAQTTLAKWTFETSLPSLSNSSTISGLAPEIGSGFASGVHLSTGTDWSNPAGNGSNESFSANEWAIGDYFQFQLSTVGYTGIGFAWDQSRSSTGPSDFKLAWSTDGVVFSDFYSYSVLDSPAWTSGTPQPTTSYFQNLDEVTALNNQTAVYLRLIATSSPSTTGGTGRMDNVTVTAIPEPSTYAAIMGVLTLGVVLYRRRQKA